MKFDYVIGNPPYQIEAGGTSTSDKPIYHLFYDEAFKISNKVELITPARFLFNAGATPKAWNEKMLNNESFKIIKYYSDSSMAFNNVGIAGGVAITYMDSSKKFGKIGIFTSHDKLNTILSKVLKIEGNKNSLVSIITTQDKFNLSKLNSDYPSINREDKRLESNIFSLPVFKQAPTGDNDVKILGLKDSERTFMYIDRKYLDTKNSNLDNYKVVLPKSYGTGIVASENAIQLIGTPVLLEPNTGYTRTFIGIGNVSTLYQANAILKYIKSRFCRILLAVLKVTQDNNPDKWKYVPLQDFTENSDIDWTKSIHEIDLKLYEKYGLEQAEIEYIESHVKEMV